MTPVGKGQGQQNSAYTDVYPNIQLPHLDISLKLCPTHHLS